MHDARFEDHAQSSAARRRRGASAPRIGLALLLTGLAATTAACGSSSSSPSSALQSNLRSLVSGAPHGDRAYWLGPQFDRTPVRFADGSWGRYAILTYNRVQFLDVDVESFRTHATGSFKGYPVRARTTTGQDVVLVFHTPTRPSAALIRSAKAALRPIPAGVIYPPGHQP